MLTSSQTLNVNGSYYTISHDGDGLDFVATVTNLQGRVVGSINWGFSEGWLPSDQEIVERIVNKDRV